MSAPMDDPNRRDPDRSVIPELVGYDLVVNGRSPAVEGWIGESLLWVLRERIGLPGAKNACEQGECGSCSVLVDGDLVCSCLVLAASAQGCDIVTVEGIAGGAGSTGIAGGAADVLSDVQRAFVDSGAVQCGFCTPGLIMAVHDLLDRLPEPTELEVREAISGNLCRCTGYGRIFEAVTRAQVQRAAASTARTAQPKGSGPA
jgi:aerobic carbon-monoxide dehydrogenase small subunit